MKYNQPYGNADTNAPYVNGDPSVGRAGSIPPAESIEYPQREIVNLITDVGVYTPDNADLHQLAKSIQAGKLVYADDAGTVNAYQITLTPAPSGYFEGLSLRVKTLSTPTGACVINVNALGAKAIVKNGGAPLVGGEWIAGDIISVTYDGTHFQLQGVMPGFLPALTGPRVLYVDATLGSDTLYDGSSATVSGGAGPFQTIQRAVTECKKFNINGYSITVHVAAGTYTGPHILPQINGSGTIAFVGNAANPSSVSLTSSTGTTVQVSGGTYTLSGFMMSCTGTSGGDPGSGISSQPNGNVTIADCAFGSCIGAHITSGGSLNINNTITIMGGAKYHLWATVSASLVLNPQTPPTLTITTAVTFSSTFAEADNLGVLYGHYGTINNPGNVTGSRYNANSNGVINTLGSGANAYPGTIAGTTSTGGQYA